MEAIPVFLCVDVEPDEGTFPPDDPPPWRGFEVLWKYLADLRPRLAEATGKPVRYLWLIRMDPQIEIGYGSTGWAATTFGSLFDEARQRGDGLGVHPHGWRWEAGEWIADHADAGWVKHCVAASFDAFRAHFGHPPNLHRFGSRWLDGATVAQVERLGARFDLTPEPGEPAVGPGVRQGATWTGWLPDYGAAPRTPYRPSPTDFRVPSENREDGLRIIPLSSGREVPPVTWHRTTASRIRHPVRTARGLVRRFRPVENVERTGGSAPSHRLLAMWKPWRSPQDFWASVEENLGEIDVPYLAFAIRSDVLLRPAMAGTFEGIVNHLLESPLARRLAFTTPADGLARPA